jgi:hypothetical protein
MKTKEGQVEFVTYAARHPRKNFDLPPPPVKKRGSKPESKLLEIGELVWDEEENPPCWMLESRLTGEKEFYLRARDCFVHTENGEEIKSKLFQDWENAHDDLRKKFINCYVR